MTDEEQEAVFLATGVADEYKFSKLGFAPDVIYDIGADCGSVTMFAHSLFPQTKIVAVEPNPWSYPRLVANFKDIPQVIPLRAAVGRGTMYEAPWADPLHWMAVSSTAPSLCNGCVESDIQGMMLDELYARYGGKRYVVKMDCEGAEYEVLMHEPSRKMVFASAYFAAEFHFWGNTQDLIDMVVRDLMRFLFDLAQTHTIYTYAYGACMNVWAKQRTNGNVEPFLPFQ